MPTNCRVAEKAVLNGSAQLWPIGPIGGHIGGISVTRHEAHDGHSQTFKNNFLHPFNYLPGQPSRRPTIGPYTRSEESLRAIIAQQAQQVQHHNLNPGHRSAPVPCEVTHE